MKILKYSILILITIIISSCETKVESPLGSKDIAIIPILTSPVNTFRNGDFDNSTVTFDVSLAEGDSHNVEFAEVEVVFNETSVIMNDIASFPYSFSSNATEVLQALSVDESSVAIGDNFIFYVITTNQGLRTRSAAAIKVPVIEFCPFTVGPSELIGKWVGTDWTAASDIELSASSEADKLVMTGISEAFMEGWWGETITERGTVLMTVNNDGTLSIPRQYIYTADYNGALSDYEIIGAGFWNNCGDKPHLDINYDIYYEGDGTGLAATYGSYLDGITYFTADIELQ